MVCVGRVFFVSATAPALEERAPPPPLIRYASGARFARAPPKKKMCQRDRSAPPSELKRGRRWFMVWHKRRSAPAVTPAAHTVWGDAHTTALVKQGGRGVAPLQRGTPLQQARKKSESWCVCVVCTKQHREKEGGRGGGQRARAAHLCDGEGGSGAAAAAGGGASASCERDEWTKPARARERERERGGGECVERG